MRKKKTRNVVSKEFLSGISIILEIWEFVTQRHVCNNALNILSLYFVNLNHIWEINVSKVGLWECWDACSS